MGVKLASGVLLALASGVAACKKEDPPPGYPPSAPPPAPVIYPAPAPPAPPAPPAATVAVPPVPLPPAAPGSGNPADSLDALRARCVESTNEFRARVAQSPLIRRSDREACADSETRSDAASSTVHGAFGRCQESAQNECPGWPGPLDQTIDKCLAQMFAEGPGPFASHGHYLNMTEPSYRGVGCGITALPNGQIWIVQNFYR